MSADSLLSLINDLLDIAKIEARKLELERVPFSVLQLVQEVVSIMSVRAQEKDLAFSLEQKCECIDKRIFIGDPNRLRQILLNLCSNAIKFTDKGGVHVDILCEKTADPKKEIIHLDVKDTGIGIAPEKSKVIFEKFVQADSSVNRKYGGTGLGLSICKMLAESMNGTISVDSRLDEGSIFRASITLEVANALEISNPAAQFEQNYNERVAQNGHHILLVDDHPKNVVVACEFLKQIGYTFEVARSGYEAIDKIKEGEFSAVLMDVQMPGMNGLEATSLIRAYEQHQALPKIRIIGMTEHALVDEKHNFLGSGMDDYIVKPFNPDELRHKIEATNKLQPASER
jgi:CheY-like chemotaxis protein